MKRRDFLKVSAAGAAATAVASPAIAQSSPEIKWRLTSSFPKSLDTIYGGAEQVSKYVAEMTDNKFQIQVFAAGEVAPGLQALDATANGTVEMSHTVSYYYVGKDPTFAVFASVPFGLNARQNNSWWYQGGGKELANEFFKKHGVIGFPCGNTGTQMGGWFRKEINTVADLQGLKMRIAGLGGQVMAKLGVNVQVLPAGEIFQAMQTGAVDAAEWVGPYDDEKLGLNKVAEFYYRPGWWEPGSSLEVNINLDEWNKLPDLYKTAVQSAAAQANLVMLSRYEAANNAALKNLVATGTQLREYSPEIMNAAYQAWLALADEFSAQDADFKTIYEQWNAFRTEIYEWNKTNEFAFTSFVYGLS